MFFFYSFHWIHPLFPHDQISESYEFVSLQWFRHIVSYHLVRWAILNADVPTVMLIGKEEISDIQVSSTLAAALFSILLQQNGAFVVLV